MERWIRGELSSPLTWSGRFTVGQTIVLSHRIILAFCEKVLIVSFFFFLLSFFFCGPRILFMLKLGLG
jgi:hypothetical protein